MVCTRLGARGVKTKDKTGLTPTPRARARGGKERAMLRAPNTGVHMRTRAAGGGRPVTPAAAKTTPKGRTRLWAQGVKVCTRRGAGNQSFCWEFFLQNLAKIQQNPV